MHLKGNITAKTTKEITVIMRSIIVICVRRWSGLTRHRNDAKHSFKRAMIVKMVSSGFKTHYQGRNRHEESGRTDDNS